MDNELFITEIDGLTFRNLDELEQYREWLSLCAAGS